MALSLGGTRLKTTSQCPSSYLREALSAHGVEADHVKIWQTVGKLRRRHGLVMRGEPRELGYRVVDWTWEVKRVRSTVRQG